MEIHLRRDRASVLSDRGHVILVAARDPLLQPGLGDWNPPALDPVTAQQSDEHDGGHPVQGRSQA